MNGPSSMLPSGPVSVTAGKVAQCLAAGDAAGLGDGGKVLSWQCATAAGYLGERAIHPLTAIQALRGGNGNLEVAL